MKTLAPGRFAEKNLNADMKKNGSFLSRLCWILAEFTRQILANQHPGLVSDNRLLFNHVLLRSKSP